MHSTGMKCLIIRSICVHICKWAWHTQLTEAYKTLAKNKALDKDVFCVIYVSQNVVAQSLQETKDNLPICTSSAAWHPPE